MLSLVAGYFQVYNKAYSLTFMDIDKATNVMGVSKDKFLESIERLAASLQDHYIDDSGNLTIIQFLSDKTVKNQNQRPVNGVK